MYLVTHRKLAGHIFQSIPFTAHVEHVEGPRVPDPVQGMTPTYPDFELLA